MRWNGAIHTSAAYTLLAGVRATMRVGVMMILASAMRHSVGRPATGMGGGIRTYGAALPAAVWMALDRPLTAKRAAPFTSVALTM